MLAQDIMTTNVITVGPDTSVRDIAKRLIANSISAVPVVERNGRLIGIVSEGDLMRRAESGTERRPSWWLSFMMSTDETARDYVKTHGKRASDVMTRSVVTVREDTPVQEVAELLERHQIKRVPVVRGDKVVGIVSRANLLRGLAAQPTVKAPTADDQTIKAAVEKAMSEAGVNHQYLNVVVMDGVVRLWGAVESNAQKDAARVAAETAPGVKEVQANMGVIPASVRAVMGAE